MTRKELVRAVADHTGMNLADTDRLVKAILAAVEAALARGETRAPGRVRNFRGQGPRGARGPKPPHRRGGPGAGLARGALPPRNGAPRRRQPAAAVGPRAAGRAAARRKAKEPGAGRGALAWAAHAEAPHFEPAAFPLRIQTPAALGAPEEWPSLAWADPARPAPHPSGRACRCWSPSWTRYRCRACLAKPAPGSGGSGSSAGDSSSRPNPAAPRSRSPSPTEAPSNPATASWPGSDPTCRSG